MSRHCACFRWKYSTGFLICARVRRWRNLSQEGISSASKKLGELTAAHKALKAQTDAPGLLPHAARGGCMLAAPSAQAEQALEDCRADIVSLIRAMHRCFRCDLRAVEAPNSTPGLENFGLVAMTIGLPGICASLVQDSLQVSLGTRCLPWYLSPQAAC